MSVQGFMDGMPILILFAVVSATMIVVFEVAYSRTAKLKKKISDTQVAQVRSIMGASLGLLAFMLAFTFSKAQSHFEARVDAYLLEVTATDAAYRGSDLLDVEHEAKAKDLLRQFVQNRLDIISVVKTESVTKALELVQEGERIHDELWDVAESSMLSADDAVDDSIFVGAVLELVRANEERLQAALYNRISPVIWIALVGMAVLAMIIMGYQASLTGARSAVATWTLAFAFAAVMTLVTDLDRPQMSLFDLDQSMMNKLQQRISD